MNDLSPTARSALSALREQVGSSEERERVRARLGQLGLTVGSAAAVTALGASASALASSTSATAAAGATSVAPSLVAGSALSGAATSTSGLVGASAAGSGAVSGMSLAHGAASAVATGSTVASAAAASGSAVTGAAAAVTSAGAISLLGAKLAALPLALKTGLVTTVLVSTVGVPLVIEQPRTSRAARMQAASGEQSGAAERAADPQALHPSPVDLDLRMPEPGEVQDHPTYATAQDVAPAAAIGAPAPAVRIVPPRERDAPLTAPQVSALASESALLERALRALRAGEVAQTERLLNEHVARHGEVSLLSRERERIRRELSRPDR